MRHLKFYLFLFFAGMMISCPITQAAKVFDLRCEMLRNPWGIYTVTPHLSWKISSDRQGTAQLYYQIIAANDEQQLNANKGNLWNSGKIKSPQSTWIVYSGKALNSRSIVFWKIRIWDEQGHATEWSETAHFSVGLIKNSDWNARYIGGDQDNPESPLFWKTFECKDNNQPTFLHINTLGYHEIYMNGEKISDDVLAPAVVQFDKRSLCMTYDVSKFIRKGENSIVIWLGKGWYRGTFPGVTKGGPFVKAQLETLHNNVWQSLIATDGTWKVRESGYSTPGPWTCLQFEGENIDATKALPDLTDSSLNQASWGKAKEVNLPERLVTPQMSEPNRIVKTFHPSSIKAINDSTYLIDMGTSITGWTQIHFNGLKRGQKITINYVDYLDTIGAFKSLSTNDYYIASGKGDETFMNKFNYHGYRYIQLTNVSQAPQKEDITGSLIRTAYDGNSSFSCSDKDMNAIHDMIHYTFPCLTLGGYMVDCPQLERLGYGGDGNSSTPSAQTMYDLYPLYANWLQAWKDCSHEDGGLPHTAPCPTKAGGGPYWCGFIITAAWQTYVNYGNADLLKEYYPYMQRWLGYVNKFSSDGLLKKWEATNYRTWYLGDWAAPEEVNVMDPNSIDIVNNCFVSVCYDTMNKIAKVLGKVEDAKKYQELQTAINYSIQSTFYNEKGKTYASSSQIDVIYPMLAGVTPENQREDVMKKLFQRTNDQYSYHLATGLVGIPVLAQWATKEKMTAFLYNMLKQRTYPGYLYMIDNGATATWEHWNCRRSRIHNCYNGIGTWFYQALAGIVPDEQEPGYRHFFIRPQVLDNMTWVKASKDTPYGELSVNWEKSNSQFTLSVIVPVGSHATLECPMKAKRITLNGKSMPLSQPLNISSGKYEVVYSLF